MSAVSVTRFKCCTKCGVTYPRTAVYYHRTSRSKDGLQVYCKPCQSLYIKNYNRQNKARLAQQKKEYLEANRELVQEQKRQSYQRNLETYKRYRVENKERRQKYVKENAAANAKHSRDYAERNPEKVKESLRQWRKRNPSRYTLDRNRRRAHKLAAEHEPYTLSDINDLWYKQNGGCHYCGSPVFAVYHVDHKRPLSRGGADGLANLCIACPFCNVSKKDKTEHEFNEYRKEHYGEPK